MQQGAETPLGLATAKLSQGGCRPKLERAQEYDLNLRETADGFQSRKDEAGL